MIDVDAEPPAASNSEDYLRTHLRQVLTIHQKMFEKLLCETSQLPLELAELLEDAANVYLGISEEISERHRLYRALGTTASRN
jgi:hypothetical protein